MNPLRRTSLAAMVVAASAVIPSVASATTISVPAAGTAGNYWTDSGVNIPAGQSVQVTASGIWSGCDPSVSPNCTTGPDGVGGFGPFWEDTDPNVNSGVLLGSVDGGQTWLAIGAGPTTVNGPGELLLADNDVNPIIQLCGFSLPLGCYTDNTGSVTVTINMNVPTTPKMNVPTNKSQCWKGGWQNMVNPSGMPFKNQGQCIAYVASGGNSGGGGDGNSGGGGDGNSGGGGGGNSGGGGGGNSGGGG